MAIAQDVISRMLPTGAGLVVCLLLAGCRGGTEGSFEVAREVDDASVEWNANSQQRFGLRPMGPARSEGSGPGLTWTVPEGWSEAQPTAMRVANFLAGGDERAECYLTLLAGDGGGLAANVNRWRAQMSLDPIDAAAVAALPRAAFLGSEGALLELQGTFTGIGGAGSSEGFGLLGLLLVAPEGSAFLKLVGPAEVVARERRAFLELAGSFER